MSKTSLLFFTGILVAITAFIFGGSGTIKSVAGSRVDQPTGFSFPLKQDFQYAGRNLSLLGLGTRKKAILNVYSVALYGSNPVMKAIDTRGNSKTKCDAIIGAKGTKAAHLTMNMALNAEKMAEALSNIEGVKQATKDKFGDMILTGIGGKLKKGESMTLEWKHPQTVAVTARGKKIGDIKDGDLYAGLLKTYLGPKAVSPALTKDIESEIE